MRIGVGGFWVTVYRKDRKKPLEEPVAISSRFVAATTDAEGNKRELDKTVEFFQDNLSPGEYLEITPGRI